jgi:hypothetical protein
MVTKQAIQNFLASKIIAVVGISSSKHKFGNSVYKELKIKGINTLPVGSSIQEFEGEKVYPDLKSIQQKVEAVVICIKPHKTMEVISKAIELGIKNIWLQQGSESKQAIEFCKDKGINLIYGQCILMFAEPTAFFHRVHRGINKFFGRLPK